MLNSKKNPLIFGTLMLTTSGLLCRGIGFFYRSFISHAFGEESMGLFQLISPVVMLSFSLTCAGMQTAISRYTASLLVQDEKEQAKKYLFTGCFFSFITALEYAGIVYGQAEFISIYLLKEARCASLLRICAISFPLAALHSCFNGYFYGKKETKIPSFTQLIEQCFRVGTVFFLYFYLESMGKKTDIGLAAVGLVVGEAVSFLISFIAYQKQDKNFKKSQKNAGIFTVTKDLFTLCIPLTCNRVIVNLLQSFESISLPLCLKQYGYSQQTALSIYGVLTGMALSLVLFPSAFTNSASVLLLPMISEAASMENKKQIDKTIRHSVRFSLLLGFGCTLFFLFLGKPAGTLLFNSSLAGTFIQTLSFLCPFLYLHTTLTSILNGLKKTGLTLLINITALLIRLGFTLFVIPKFGISGYLWGLLCSELLSAGFCLWFLKPYFL